MLRFEDLLVFLFFVFLPLLQREVYKGIKLESLDGTTLLVKIINVQSEKYILTPLALPVQKLAVSSS